MSAPKPRVRRGGDEICDDLWLWECACGVRGLLSSDWSSTLDEAHEHSRTHTVEWVADGLLRSGDEMVRKGKEAHDEIDRQHYADEASAYYESAFRVRRLLVN